MIRFMVGAVLALLGLVGLVGWVLNGYSNTPLALVQAGMICAGAILVGWALS